MDTSTVICWTSPFVIEGVSGIFCHFNSIFFYEKILLANSVDPDQIPHHVASDLSLHCFPMTFFYRFPDKNGLNQKFIFHIAEFFL